MPLIGTSENSEVINMDSVGYLKDLAIILLAAKVFGICARKPMRLKSSEKYSPALL